MPILDLQRSMRRLGRIRMGSQVPTQNGKLRPNKLETWRMTSPSEDMLHAAAELYGGTVTEWVGSPSGKQWELFTDASTIDVVIPPGEMSFSQWYEMWSGGGCMRRCDGQIEQTTGDACMCPADRDQRLALANNGQACKPTTRLFVIQPHLPDVGLWHFESHGFYAAIELAGSIEVLRAASATGGLIPAKLAIEQRQSKRDGQTRNFAVPVIQLPTLTPHTLMTGEIPAGELNAAPVERAALPAPTPAPAPAKKAAPAKRAPATRSAAPAQVGDGSAFVRAIQSKAKRKGIEDPEKLDVICLEATGKPLAEMQDPKDANKVMEALDGNQSDTAGPAPELQPVGVDGDGRPF